MVPRTVILLAIIVSVVLASCADKCQPWKNTCTRKSGLIDTRFAVTLPATQEVNGVNVSYYSYGFCAQVDTLQVFQLNSSSLVSLYNANSTGTVPKPAYLRSNNYVWAFGAGKKATPLYPGNDSNAYALYYEGESDVCNTNGVRGPAVVTMLIYNVTLDGGEFGYENGDPIGTGFQPTCDDTNTCMMDAGLKCIGPLGRKNCAKCLNAGDYTDVLNYDLTIFTSFYGSDSRGKKLLSGSSNPLNFRVFAGGNAYNSVSDDMTSLKDTAKKVNPLAQVDSISWSGLSKAQLPPMSNP